MSFVRKKTSLQAWTMVMIVMMFQGERALYDRGNKDGKSNKDDDDEEGEFSAETEVKEGSANNIIISSHNSCFLIIRFIQATARGMALLDLTLRVLPCR